MFAPATDESLSAAYEFLKEKVDPNIDPTVSTWKDVKEKNAILCEYLASHTRVDRYHLEFFKCGNNLCKICSPVRFHYYLFNM
jgi:tRNA(Ile)-lysidine synthase TilS/MesJ